MKNKSEDKVIKENFIKQLKDMTGQEIHDLIRSKGKEPKLVRFYYFSK